MGAIITQKQNNKPWTLTWKASGRYPIVADRIYATLADAQAYVDDLSATASAVPGLVLSVVNDTNEKNNGVYFIQSIADGENAGVLVKAGSGNGSMTVENLTIIDGKVSEATVDNIGQIIYVTSGTEDYPKAPYIVDGEGSVARLGTTTATGDIAGDVAALKSVVGIDGDNATGLFLDVKNLEAKDSELEDSIGAINRVLYEDGNVVVFAKVADVYSKTDADAKFDTISSVDEKVKAVDDKAVANAEAISNLSDELQGVKDTYATKQSVENLSNTVDTKASQTDLDAAVESIATNSASITTLQGEVSGIKDNYATKIELQGVEDKIVDYTIKPITTVEGYASSYQLFKGDIAVTDSVINIPLDQVLKSAEIKEVTEAGQPYANAVIGDKYIEFSFQNTDALQYLPVQDLVDVYTAGSYINISNSNEISVNYDGIYSDIKNQIVTDLSLATTSDVSTAKTEAINAAATAAQTAITTALGDYYTSEELDTKFADYQTAEDTNAAIKAVEDGYKAADTSLSTRITTLEGLVVGGEGEGIQAIIGDLNEVKTAVGKPAGTDSEGNPTEATGFHKDIETISLTVSGNTNAISELNDSVVKSISLNGTEIKPTENVVTLPVSYSFDSITAESKDLVSGGAVKSYVDTAIEQINIDISALTDNKLSGEVVDSITVDTATNNTIYLVGEQHIPQIKLNDTLYTIGANYYARADIFAGEGVNGLMTASMFAKLEDIGAINEDALDDILAK